MQQRRSLRMLVLTDDLPAGLVLTKIKVSSLIPFDLGASCHRTWFPRPSRPPGVVARVAFFLATASAYFGHKSTGTSARVACPGDKYCPVRFSSHFHEALIFLPGLQAPHDETGPAKLRVHLSATLTANRTSNVTRGATSLRQVVHTFLNARWHSNAYRGGNCLKRLAFSLSRPEA
jgi:hypothetical protein